MRTKLFPDEAVEALDELEYHPHHVHASGARASGAVTGSGGGAGVGTGTTGPQSSTALPKNASDTAIGGGGVGSTASLGGLPTGSGRSSVRGDDVAGGSLGGRGDGTGITALGKSGEVDGGEGGSAVGGERGKGRSSANTKMQRMNKTFRPDPLGAYTGDRSTLRFKPRRQEGLKTLRPRQLRTVFDASQISPMLQVSAGNRIDNGWRRV